MHNNKKYLRLIIIVFSVYLIVTTTTATLDLWKAGDKLTERQKTLAQLQAQRDDLLRQKTLIDNPNYWEKIARDKLGLTKPGEEVLIIPQELLVDNTKVASEPAVPNWKKWLDLVL